MYIVQLTQQNLIPCPLGEPNRLQMVKERPVCSFVVSEMLQRLPLEVRS
jgi:hypothetical protein